MALCVGSKTATYPAEPGAVESPDSVLGVPVVLELDECEAGRVPSDPHVPQRTVLGEGVLDIVLARVVPEVADVHLQMIVDAEKRDRRVERAVRSSRG